MPNKLILLTILSVLISLSAHSEERFWSAVQGLEQTQSKIATQLLVSTRNLQVKHYNKKTSCVAVIFHGLFQSPKDMQTMINYFYEKQCNVIAPLLEGHWRNDLRAFYKINYKDWKQQGLNTLNAAREMGDKIILVGHSTGGLLAFSLALEQSKAYNIKGLVLFSPALKLRTHVKLFSKYGSRLNLNANSLTTSHANNPHPPQPTSEYDMQLRPAMAGYHVQSFIESIFESGRTREDIYKSLKIPTLLISTENDSTIDHDEVLKMQSAQPSLFKLISYQKSSGIKHDNIQRTALDLEPSAPKTWSNPFFSEILIKIENIYSQSLLI